jgi:hypothetical protein
MQKKSKNPKVRVDLDIHETILSLGGKKLEVAAGFIRITAGRSGGLIGNILHFWEHNKKGSRIL